MVADIDDVCPALHGEFCILDILYALEHQLGEKVVGRGDDVAAALFGLVHVEHLARARPENLRLRERLPLRTMRMQTRGHRSKTRRERVGALLERI